MTPSHIDVLFHYHVTREPHPRAFAPAVIEHTKDLQQWGLIEWWSEQPQRWDTTAKGGAHIHAILTLPLPECRWITPNKWEVKS